MNRELIMAAVAALSLAACGPDLSSGDQASKGAGATPAQPAAAPAQPATADKPAGSESTVAQTAAPAAPPTQAADAEKPEGGAPAAGKEDDKKDDAEKKPQ